MPLSVALSPKVQAAVLAALAQLDAAAVRARAAANSAGGFLSSAWQRAVGAGSTGEAAQAVARAQENVARDYRAAAERLSSDAAALAWLRELAGKRLADTSAVEALARSLTVTGAAREVAVETAKDVAKVAAWTAGWLVPVALAALFVVATAWSPRRS